MPEAPLNPKQAGTPFAGPSGKPWLVKSPTGVLSAVAQTITIFFRHQFGERYLNPRSLLTGMACFAAYLVAMRFYAIGGKHSVEVPVPIISWLTWLLFATAFLAIASFHMFSAINRRQMFRDEFSYSSGRPGKFWTRLPFVSDEWDVERFYEPAIILVGGVVLSVLSNWFGPYLIVAGACAFHVAKTKHQLRRELELNVLDTRTEASNVPRFEIAAPVATVKSVTASPPAGKPATGDIDPLDRLRSSNPDLAREMDADNDGRTGDGQGEGEP